MYDVLVCVLPDGNISLSYPPKKTELKYLNLPPKLLPVVWVSELWAVFDQRTQLT